MQQGGENMKTDRVGNTGVVKITIKGHLYINSFFLFFLIFLTKA